MTHHVLTKRPSKAAKSPSCAQSAQLPSRQVSSPRSGAPSASLSSPSSAELQAIAGKEPEATPTAAQETIAAEAVALPARGDDCETGKGDRISTTTSTAFSAERKSGAADAKASASGAAGTCPEAATKAGMANAKTSGTPHPSDRTFVGQPKPRDPAEIGLGSVVLAHEGPDDGWWEAEVIGINGQVFSLRWRDYPTQPTILRKAIELALLPPGEA
jgi:hypothetical protein